MYTADGFASTSCILYAFPSLGGIGVLCAGGKYTGTVTSPVYFMPLEKTANGEWQPWKELEPMTGKYVSV